MTDFDDALYDTPDDGVWPGDDAWLQWSPETVPDDFVERTLDALRRGAPEGLSPDLLGSYTVPTPSPDFVARTLDALRADREQADDRITGVLDQYQVPEPSVDFVTRTLAAVRSDRSRRARRPWFATVPLLAAAAIALFALLPDPELSDRELNPAPLATALSLQLRGPEPGPELFPADPLLLLADGIFED